MRYRIAFVLVPSALVFAMVPASVRAAEKPVPNAAVLLDRVIKANMQPGTLTIVSTDIQHRPGRPVLTMKSTAQWNDANHFRVTTVGDGNTMLAVANGTARILYTSGDNAFERNGKRSYLVTPMLQGMLKGLAPGLADPVSRRDFAKGVVTLTTYHGDPVYRIYDSPHANDKKVYLEFLVGRADLLIRKFAFSQSAARSETMTASYHKEPKPFPASTFEFAPPAGAKEVSG